LTIEQMAARHYRDRLAFDEELMNDGRWPSVGIDDLLVKKLREAISGRLDNDRLNALASGTVFGHRVYRPMTTSGRAMKFAGKMVAEEVRQPRRLGS